MKRYIISASTMEQFRIMLHERNLPYSVCNFIPYGPDYLREEKLKGLLVNEPDQLIGAFSKEETYFLLRRSQI